MSNTKFTPGAWMRDGISVTTFAQPRKTIALAHPDTSITTQASIERMRANTSLMATAPEMYAALAKAVAWFRDYERQHRAKLTSEDNMKADTNAERAAMIEALLTKARGEQP